MISHSFPISKTVNQALWFSGMLLLLYTGFEFVPRPGQFMILATFGGAGTFVALIAGTVYIMSDSNDSGSPSQRQKEGDTVGNKTPL
jgi:hypothetical protein